jgi:Phage tail tube protein, GTA-gp10
MTDATISIGGETFPVKLTFALITDLEKKTGQGIGILANRLFHAQFSLADVVETIRLGLLGGGMKSERVEQIIAAYVNNQPLVRLYPHAVEILSRAWFGEPQAEPVAPDHHQETAEAPEAPAGEPAARPRPEDHSGEILARVGDEPFRVIFPANPANRSDRHRSQRRRKFGR